MHLISYGCDWGLFLLFDQLVQKLKDNSGELFKLLMDVSSESDVLDVLSSFLNCDRDVKFDSSPVLIVDLVCGSIGVEVEYNKQPHEGIHQALAYKAFLGLEPVVVHVLDYCTVDYVGAFRKLLNLLKFLNIKGAIICINNGEIIEIE